MMTTEDMNKDVTVQVRLTAEEHKRWLANAEAEDRTLSNWIRRQCNAAAVDIETIDVVEKKSAERAAKAKKGGR